MQNRFLIGRVTVALALTALAGAAMAGQDLDALQDAWPAARVLRDAGGGAVTVYGAPMTGAADPLAAADAWLNGWSGLLVEGELELTLEHATAVRDGRFTAFLYSQTMDGLPVDGAAARVLVRHAVGDGGQDRVVLASGRLAARPAGGFGMIRTAPADVVGAAQRLPAFSHLTDWSEPELVVFIDRTGEDAVSRRAWRFQGWAELPRHDAWEFIYDASTGRPLATRAAMHHTDVTGTALGMGSPGNLPDTATNPPVAVPMPLLTVGISGGGSAPTALDGAFVIPHAGTAPVTVEADVAGPFIRVDNLRGGEISDAVVATPPGPADLLLNDAPAEFLTSQVNAFAQASRTYDFIKSRAPDFTGLDMQLLTNVNSNQTCNAFFTSIGGLRIEFYNAGGGCVNSAYSTVVSHEYGHFIVNRLGLDQGAFGEGFGDATAILLHDTDIVGERFFTSGGHIRNPETARRQVGCSGGSHFCGEQLGGTWRWIRNNIGDTRGSEEGLEIAQDLFVAWSMITLGGAGSDAIAARTAVEVLTVDDDDGMLENGTPNYDDIRLAFERHGVESPPLALLTFDLPDGTPDLLTPEQATSFRVNLLPRTAEPAPGTARLMVSLGGLYVPLAMTETGPNEYVAELPALPVFAAADYYIEAETTTGAVDTFPPGAPSAFLTAIAGAELARLDFETAEGWTVENTALLDGAWERGAPVGGGAREDPASDFDGSGQAWLTANRSGNSDVDGGPTRLTSPVYDLSDVEEAQVSYARWFRSINETPDRLTVEFSDDGGESWTPAETVPHTPSGWVLKSLLVSEHVVLNDRFRVRFIATDNPNDSVTEAGIDRFWILTDGGGCRADLTGDGELDFFDFLEFQTLFGAGDLRADFTGDAALDFFDFLAFQSEFAAGCP